MCVFILRWSTYSGYLDSIEVTCRSVPIQSTQTESFCNSRNDFNVKKENESMTKIYTLSEVAEHNTAKDCWLVIDGKVYDVTSFLEEHPGGEDVLLSVTAKDATDDFEDVGHSNSARGIMKKFEVGEIEASLIPQKLKVVDRATEPQYNPDKSGEFIVKILQILIPLAFLALVVASNFFTAKEEVAPDL